MFRIYYTIQCTYSKYVVHINICIYIYVHYIYQYCKHVIVPQRGYIYISQQWDGVPLNSLTSKGTSLDCLKAWMPAAVGDMTWPFWQSIRSCWFHQISPVMHVPQKRTLHNPQQTEIISNHCFCAFFPVILRLAEPTHGAFPVHRRSLRELRQHCVQWWCWWLDMYRYVSMMEWRENEKSLKVLNHTSPWFSYVLLFRESRFRRCQIWAHLTLYL